MQVGNDFSTKVSMPGSPRMSRDENGFWTKEVNYRIQQSLVDTVIPSNGQLDSGFYCAGVDYAPVAGTSPRVVEVREVWKTVPAGFVGTSPADAIETVYDSNTTRTEKKVEEHPGWDNLSDAQKSTLRTFYSTFEVISTTFRKTTRQKKTSYTVTEETILGTVNAIEAPSGLSGATAGKWKNVGRTLNYTKRGILEISETWQYDLYNWQGTITPSTNLAALLAYLGGN